MKEYNFTLEELREVVQENKFSDTFRRGAYDDETISLDGFLYFLEKTYGFRDYVYLDDYKNPYDFHSYGIYGDWTDEKYDKLFAKHILIKIKDGYAILPCVAHTNPECYLQPKYIRLIEGIDFKVIRGMVAHKQKEINELQMILLNDCKNCKCSTCLFRETDECIEEQVIGITPCNDCGGVNYGYAERLADRRTECGHYKSK